ncbi:PREDICTED: uncharacterized protein LOC106551546 [Thamnophis sirtalis]|uniref:Gypsy retrotransposon integrase-like protein 1 n=1 Tax=Thamnophis sirtalis TaxID=35019 RepID=A0A6I9YN02_9SAUR|nr:PREDICTED: uncharacterized protein LOC106551546 [Thamnophis sirtalis]
MFSLIWKELGQCCNASERLVVTKENTPLGSIINLDGDIYSNITADAELRSVLLKLFKLFFKTPVLAYPQLLEATRPPNELFKEFLLSSRFKNLLGYETDFINALRAYPNALFLIPAISFNYHLKVGYHAIRIMKDVGLAHKAFFLHPHYLSALDRYWKLKRMRELRLSTGFMFTSFALEFCDDITLYGFWPFFYDLNGKPISHHYYDNVLPLPFVHNMSEEFSHYLKMSAQGVLHLHLGAAWAWGRQEASAFVAVKHLLISNDVLVQYSEHLLLVLACDASPYGVGTVLCHQLPSGAEVPVAFFSHTLSASERNYAQIDKEALAIVARVRRFHHYLYGRPFVIVTDHKPLLGLLAGDRPAPQVLSPRMTHWFVFLASYEYQLNHRLGKQIAHADALSRCPLPEAPEDPAAVAPVFLIDNLNLPTSAADIAWLSARDQVISQVLDWVRRGWPKYPVDPVFLPFKSRLAELSVQRGCLLWGHQVVVPASLRTTVLQQLHHAHPGIVRMKALGRSYVWWPKLDQDIAAHVAGCPKCQSAQALPPKAKPRTWEPPSSPWSWVHVDFAGPIQGRMLFIAVDAFSKWVEVVHMPSTTADALVATLHHLFATHGLPDVLVSDNGPRIQHALISPSHPASNGLAERAVRSVKEALAKMDHLPWQQRIDDFLLAHHSTPSPESNTSPAELLMGRRLRTTLDCLHPAYATPTLLDSRGGTRSFGQGEAVYARNYGGHPLWLPGIVVDQTGPCSYRVRLNDGRTWRCHCDQLRGRHQPPTNLQPPTDPQLRASDAGPRSEEAARQHTTCAPNRSGDLPGSGSTTAELGDATATSCRADTSRQPTCSHQQIHTFEQATRGPEARKLRDNRQPVPQTEAATYLVGWHRPWLVDDLSDRHPVKKGPRQGIQILQAAPKGLACPAKSGGGQRIYKTTHARA